MVAPLPPVIPSTAMKLFGNKTTTENEDVLSSPPIKTRPMLLREPRQSLAQARRVSLAIDTIRPSGPIDGSTPLSPLAAYYSPRNQRSDAYRLEMERREIHTLFCLFDVDGSGAVSREEMTSLLRAMTQDLTDLQLDHLMNDLMAGQTRTHRRMGRPDAITFENFYQWCHHHIHEHPRSKEELVAEIFRMIDTDASGFITVDEFISIFNTLGQSLDHDDVRELVYQMDRKDQGKIDVEAFTKMFQKHEV